MMRFKKQAGTFLVVLATLATTVIVATSPASAARAETYKDRGPDRLYNGSVISSAFPSSENAAGWTRRDSNCNRWGWACTGGAAYFTDEVGAISRWWLPDVQGMFRVDVKYPEGKNNIQKPTDGSIRVEIFEKRSGDTLYRRVRNYTDTQNERKSGWYGLPRLLELDGKVLVKVTVLSGYVGISDVQVEHRGVLPEHWIAAQVICRTSNLAKDKAVSDFLDGFALRSPLLGDEVEALQVAGGDAHATKRGVAQDLLIAAVFRIALEINESGAQDRSNKINEQCLERDAGWHFTGLGWTHYNGWHYAATQIAKATTLGGHSGCRSWTYNGLDTGCIKDLGRR